MAAFGQINVVGFASSELVVGTDATAVAVEE